ncbi:glycine N-methyltransferase [Neodiprion pinetum]|uniref:Glycine N-methyltransferase n=1 Tax=Neodiprion lecontei TaxID=441921 RepID=A0A6J0CCA5_NEOLC|nr:glycine N-methyltransferase [Neodiprion lecontei]XP_046430993.1 glycine N-methyltransferase [Neodiprion fabricii]XP_046430994.1 glycine N-methyltransferase [Neodiprion fabricii]XP_046487695.1 glycine N-methyltransferase [Neodiprion pinetum]XP_046487696.1 glycine N-methyltransferase [Neodiprion pinetum]XP_046599123.1 glycine N-methyltransferase [Neodiprion lecontei]XP_046624449.1 glycine N-methyltransferase [Neodiprion virginianus]XP_046624450.1 glycine N-methyltransferase [Neodiprion virg
MVDSVFRTRSLGTAAEGVRDQYADGKAAKVWEVFIGDQKSRTQNYKDFIVSLLRQNGCQRILDVACGTGIDSIMLLEEGFEVVSVDASDKMLKYALKARWARRKESAFDNWIIEEANWLTLADDIRYLIGEGFDAVVCLGNSFAHMPDSFGDQREQKQALANFERCVKPGGLLLIDHRNYDDIIATGFTPSKCIYYNSSHMTDIKTSILFVSGKAAIVALDYLIDLGDGEISNDHNSERISEFRLSYYPHRLSIFRDMLNEAFHYTAKHTIYGDFKPLDQIKNPGFYIHVLQKRDE